MPIDNKVPRVNNLSIVNLTSAEARFFDQLTDELSQNHEPENDQFRWAYIGQLLINVSEYGQ